MNLPRKVLVSGSSGLIGSALLPVLKSNGYEVKRLVRKATGRADELVWEPATPLSPEAVSGLEAVVHLAGESIVGRWNDTKKREILESRVGPTQTLAQAMASTKQPPRVFVCASAVGFYGSRGEEVLREESPSGNGFVAEVCRQWEGASAPAAQAGIRVVQTRFGVVLSAKGGALAKMLPPFRMGVGGKVGDGRQWMPWVDISDVAGAILFALSNESLHGPVNVTSPNAVRNSEFTKTLASVLSRPAIFPMPAFAARLAFGEMADELLLSSQHVEPGKLKAAGFPFKNPQLRKSLESLLRK